MKSLKVVAVALVVGLIAVAQDSSPDRGKVGTNLTYALNGTDRWVATTTHHLDGGANETNVECTYVGEGINVLTWCDGYAYIVNAASTGASADGGVMPSTQMIPVVPWAPYSMGLFGPSRGYFCMKQTEAQLDAGRTTQCHNFRRY